MGEQSRLLNNKVDNDGAGYPEGISSLSPRLRGTGYLGSAMKKDHNSERVAATPGTCSISYRPRNKD
jgi:hypothetical protein